MKSIRFMAVLLCLCLLFSMPCLPAARGEEPPIDYAAQAEMDQRGETVKLSVVVKNYVDGDTVHFTAPEAENPSQVIKARFLACNAPESTGKIEEWGKRASDFTRQKLAQAQDIVLESDNGQWNLDSTSTRILVWVWYKPAEGASYRNLNIELLQEGLAIASNAARNRYGDLCMAAIAQARARELCVYSHQKDPDYYYGDAVELTLRELRLYPEKYNGTKVAFSGVITVNANQSVFVEEYDEETGLYYGISVYYGYNLSGAGLEVLTVGNRARIVGTLQFYETGQTWQVSGVTYRMMKPKDPGNLQTLSTGHAPAWVEVTPEWLWGTQLLPGEDDKLQSYQNAFLAQATSVSLRNGTVLRAAKDEASSHVNLAVRGQTGSPEVLIRLYFDGAAYGLDENTLPGKTLDVHGIVLPGTTPCIGVYTPNGLTVHPE